MDALLVILDVAGAMRAVLSNRMVESQGCVHGAARSCSGKSSSTSAEKWALSELLNMANVDG